MRKMGNELSWNKRQAIFKVRDGVLGFVVKQYKAFASVLLPHLFRWAMYRDKK